MLARSLLFGSALRGCRLGGRKERDRQLRPAPGTLAEGTSQEPRCKATAVTVAAAQSSSAAPSALAAAASRLAHGRGRGLLAWARAGEGDGGSALASGASSDSRGSADSCALLAREPGDPAKLPSAGTEVGRWHLGRGADSDPAVGSAGELAGELHSLPLNVLDMPLDGHECVDRLVFGGPVAHAAVSLGTLRALHFKGRRLAARESWCLQPWRLFSAHRGCVGGASCTSEGASPSGISAQCRLPSSGFGTCQLCEIRLSALCRFRRRPHGLQPLAGPCTNEQCFAKKRPERLQF